MPARTAALPRRSVLALLGATLATTACSARPEGAARALSVFAAASLTEALDAALAEFESQTGLETQAVYAGSAQLARQIQNGAPADLFISADAEWMDWLEARGRIDVAARHTLAGNRLVLISPASGDTRRLDLTPGPALSRRFLARLSDGRLATAEPEVPAGRYGRQALTALGLWTSLEPHLAPAENVRAALTLVARGEAELGIVYQTDAIAEPNVAIVAEFADDLHSPIVYPAAPVLQPAMQAESCARLMDYLSGSDGQQIFQRFGFAPPP
ncbi:MAG: molybdate ABC transporter substrate-binding protein [Caulobacterales bacterium]|nr:molybdate ABC transporter substrate-binding protein [Caulobacterales bacterium]